MTIEKILQLDSSIGDILSAARKYRRCRDKDRAYCRLKTELAQHVGFKAKNPDLQTSQAYDTALRVLCENLAY